MGRSYLDVIALRVPRATAWEPLAAEQFMQGVFALSVPVSLIMSRYAKRVEWLIEVPHTDSEALVKLLYSLLPQSQLEVRGRKSAPVGYHTLELQGAVPFIAPLRSAKELKASDPMKSILGALSDLRADEHLLYELGLEPITERHLELGERMLMTSTVSWWRFLRPRSALSALIEKAFGWDRVERYVTPVQRVAEAKMSGPLKQATLRLKIRAGERGRAQALGALLEPAMAIFEREGFNFLVPASHHSYPLVLSPGEVAALWHWPTSELTTPGIYWAESATGAPPLELFDETHGIRLGTNVFQGQARPVYLNNRDRVTHVNLIGKTRVGKSTELYWMARQDIRAGRGVAVIDPHGDLVDELLYSGIPARREREVVLLDLADQEHVIGLNLLKAPESVPRDIVADHALSVIRKLFADQWSETRMEDSLYAALSALIGFEGATLVDVPRLFTDAIFRETVLKGVDDPVTLEFWRQEFDPLSERYQREIARPITNRVRKFYRSEQLRRIVCQSTSLDFGAILDKKKIFLANLRGSVSEEANTLGALLISKLQMAAMTRAGRSGRNREPFYLYIDEAQNFVTTSLPRLFSEAGKYGLSLTLANQYLQQLSGNTLEAVMGNVGTSIIFRVGPRDAQAFARFTKPYFSGEDLLQLSRFRAVVTMQHQGQTLPPFTMETQAPPARPKDARARAKRIRTHSRQTYATESAVVERQIQSRLNGSANGTGQETEPVSNTDEVSFFD
jgi:hypothetical protein